MFHELTVGGVLVSPFVVYAAVALAILLLLRPLLRLIRFQRVFANPPLAEAGLYVCILALLIVIL
ncbi:hypothetical protein OPKNFCMD_2286 [Methylobacterium crusticola]|uniref:DUF1656 domain-containing protein n=1 Tax=Methylobacterium crusticola TaxID=1697972 RepID=A0ABQ4QXB8_9HYPH|nr:DUF1656 domain-containing protein [Methylobacterium crusticola]GJD49554.1 hypothetical protein OPKNFCMD_2286 [Methylobacterium crusticola]